MEKIKRISSSSLIHLNYSDSDKSTLSQCLSFDAYTFKILPHLLWDCKVFTMDSIKIRITFPLHPPHERKDRHSRQFLKMKEPNSESRRFYDVKVLFFKCHACSQGSVFVRVEITFLHEQYILPLFQRFYMTIRSNKHAISKHLESWVTLDLLRRNLYSCVESNRKWFTTIRMVPTSSFKSH